MANFILRAVGARESIVWRHDDEATARLRFSHIKACSGTVGPFDGLRYAILTECVDSCYIAREEWFAGI